MTVPSTILITEADVESTEYYPAAAKAAAMNGLLKLIDANFARSKFTRAVYTTLTVPLDLSAHFNIDGFYRDVMSTPEAQIQFLDWLIGQCDERSGRVVVGATRADLWDDVLGLFGEDADDNSRHLWLVEKRNAVAGSTRVAGFDDQVTADQWLGLIVPWVVNEALFTARHVPNPTMADYFADLQQFLDRVLEGEFTITPEFVDRNRTITSLTAALNR